MQRIQISKANLRKQKQSPGCLGAQWVKRLTPDFSSSHDLTVCEMEPRSRLCTNSAEPAWGNLDHMYEHKD